MKMLYTIILAAALLDLKISVVHAANPAYTDFYTNQFDTTGYKVALRPFVSSVTIPMGAWFVNNVANESFLSAATALSVTNVGDGFAFADAVTNVINTRFALPWDCVSLSTVQLAIEATCTGTNHASATNVVFAARAAAIGDADSLNNLTWGTAVITTNHMDQGAYIHRTAVTTPITIGGNLFPAKSVLWQIQRLGSAAGDTMTNSSMAVTEVRVFYTFLLRTNLPSASP